MRATYHHGDLRQAFLDAALATLDAAGELPSWRALARACAVSHTAPYRHFANFEALQAAVAAAAFARLSSTVESATSGESEAFARLAAGLRAYVAFGRAHPSWYELMFGRSLELLQHAETREASIHAYGTLVSAIADCGVRAPATAAFTLWSALHGLTDLARSGLRPPVPGDTGGDPLEGVIAMCVAHVQALATRDAAPPARAARRARQPR